MRAMCALQCRYGDTSQKNGKEEEMVILVSGKDTALGEKKGPSAAAGAYKSKQTGFLQGSFLGCVAYVQAWFCCSIVFKVIFYVYSVEI